MTRKDIRDAYDTVAPSEEQKERMLDAILSAVPETEPVRKDIVVMKKYTKKPALIAALVAVMIFFMGCAVVTLGLKDLKMGQHESYAEPGETAKVWDEISLEGFVGSPEYQAAMEWETFMQEYDPDGSVRTAAQFHNYKAPENYEAFHCITQEMQDKLDEICAKYNLKLPGKGWMIMNVDDIFEATSTRDIRVEGIQAVVHLDNGYCYADGSFYAEGGAQFPGQRVGDMIFINCERKGTFGTSTDSVTNVEDFDQWTYTTKDGTEVLLAVTGVEVVMIADREEFFTTVRLYGEGCSMVPDAEGKRKMAEKMADCFDFTISPKPADTAVMERAAKAWDDMQAEMEADFNKEFQRKDYQALMENSYGIPHGGSYALADLNGDGHEELILKLLNGNVENIVTYDGKQTSLVMEARRLNHFYIEGGVKWWLAEGNILVNHIICGDCQRYSFFRLENGAYKLFDFVEYHDETKAWTRSEDGDEKCEKNLTESEAKELIASYKPMELDFKPVSEFPMD